MMERAFEFLRKPFFIETIVMGIAFAVGVLYLIEGKVVLSTLSFLIVLWVFMSGLWRREYFRLYKAMRER